MSGLRECPFCGKQAECDEYNGEHFVSCKDDGCNGFLHEPNSHLHHARFFTKADAIRAWNTRAETNVERALKEAKAMLLDCEKGYHVFHTMLRKVGLNEGVLTAGDHMNRLSDYLDRIAAIERGEA